MLTSPQRSAPPPPGDLTPGVALTGPEAPALPSAAEVCPWPDHDANFAYERLMGATGGHGEAVRHFLVDLAVLGVTDVRKYVAKKTLAKLRELVDEAEARRAQHLAARPGREGGRPTFGKPLDTVTVAYVA